jgi:hypothetical protein
MSKILAHGKGVYGKALAALAGLALALTLAPAVATPAYAETPTFTDWASIQNSSIKVGDTVTVDLYMSASTDFSAGELKLSYPDDKLNVVKDADGNVDINTTQSFAKILASEKDGVVTVTFMSNENSVVKAGTSVKIATLEFTAASAGDISLSMLEDDKYCVAGISGDAINEYPIKAGDAATAKIAEDGVWAYSYSQNINTEGKIGLRFYMEIPESLNTTGAYALFNGEKILFSNAGLGDNKYMFETFVVAKDIAKEINIKLYDGDDKAIALKNKSGSKDFTETGITYSIEKYCEAVIASSAGDKAITFAKSLLDYGHTAALYIPDYSADVSGLTLYQKEKVDAVTLADVNSYKAVAYTIPSDVKVESTSLNAETDTSIRIRCSGNLAGHVFTCNGKTIVPEDNILVIPNIAAKDLDESYMIQADGTDMMSFPALFWSRAILKSSSSSDAAIMMAKTFYLYNQAANDYFA